MEEWLQAIGLKHYAEAFRAQQISFDQLIELTDEDLKDLGLLIGERRRFHRAVLHLLRAAPPALPQRPATLTERRQLTMMFVDLVGSSELGEMLEPEDLMEVIRAYRECCSDRIHRYGGSVARYVGDGVLAYFSHPVATENDPERAVRAALDIVHEVQHLTTPAPSNLRVRIGIATGRVIIGDMVTSGVADLRTVLGSPPNFAARLQGLASPGSIVVASETYERVSSLFAAEDLGQLEVRGFVTARRAWRILNELPRRGWFATGSPRQLTPFCNRRTELARLGEMWTQATQGIGQAVLVTGEAGIGKSRLIETFLSFNCTERCRVIHFAASQLDVDSAFLPFTHWLRSEVKAESGDDDAVDQTDIADLLDVATDIGNLEATPEQRREAILAALANRVLQSADAEPLCVVAEDLHWLDPSSLELLERLRARIGDLNVMLLFSARESFEAPWTSDDAVSTLHLRRLEEGDIAEMLKDVADRAALPAVLIAQILRKSDGVPLFAVELVRGMLNPDGSMVAATPHFVMPDEPSGSVPAFLYDSLMARLDRAGLAKEIAQIAAVLGRSVKTAILSHVVGRDRAELEQPLTALINAGVLYREGMGPSERYTFTHALLQDAAYHSILRDHRWALHHKAADALRELEPGIVEHQPELLALHLSEAAQPTVAAPYWIEAARRCLSRSALMEAKRLLRRGIAALEKVGGGKTALNLRLEMMALLGPALIGVDGPGSPETRELYDTAWNLCKTNPDAPSYVPVYWGWWRMSRDYIDKLARAQTLLSRARFRADNGELLQAHHCAWASHYCVGSLQEACEHAEAGLAIYSTGDYRDHARQYGNHDAAVCAHGELAQALWMRGQPREALAHERRSITFARGLNHVGSLVHAMDMRLLHRAYRGDVARVGAQASEFMDLTTQYELRDHRAKALIFRGWSMARSTDVTKGRKMLENGITAQREIGTDEDFPIYITLLADILIRTGETERAIDELREAYEDSSRSGLQIWMPEVLRLLGVATAAAHPGKVAEAMQLFDESLRLAGNQGAHMLGLRTAVNLMNLQLKHGATASGAHALQAVLSSIAEDDGSADIRAARTLFQKCRALGLVTEGSV